jgi:tagatose-1,6-bisphosphate aldolase
MNQLTPGKMRGLQACSTAEGTFAILAVDHRDSLRAIIDPAAPHTVPAAQLTEVKLAVVKHLAPATSAVLLDPVYSAAQAISEGQLPGNVGLVCAVEEQGYLGDPHARQTPLIAGWTVAKTKRLGANGIKLLLFYNPEAGEATVAQEGLVRALAADCRREDLPFFLEPIIYPAEPALAKGSPEFAAFRPGLIVEMVRRLSRLGPDVMKIEFPVDVTYDPDPAAWADACAAVNDASSLPWTILSGGGSFETFKQQVRVACQAGSSGFVCGRSIWQEAATLSGQARLDFLESRAYQRLVELRQIAQEQATPWQRRFAGAPVDEEWYKEY